MKLELKTERVGKGVYTVILKHEESGHTVSSRITMSETNKEFEAVKKDLHFRLHEKLKDFKETSSVVNKLNDLGFLELDD